MASRLFTTFYIDSHERRAAELDWCITENKRAFDAVHIWHEGAEGTVGKWARPRFVDLLNWAYEWSDDGDLIVVANTDVVVPRESIDLMQNIGPGDAMALSRWDMMKRGPVLFDVNYSQDCWVFLAPPKLLVGGDYYFGIPGCDNRFAYELQQAGYRVTNPSRTIRTFHHHQSGIRTATNHRKHRVPRPYLFVKPTALEAVNA